MNTASALVFSLTGMLLGIMLFFAASVAPTVFKTLPAEHAGIFLRKIFPRYYIWGIVLATLMAIAAYGTDSVIFIMAVIIVMLFVFARQLLVPQINKARDDKLAGEAAAEVRFKRLHLLSVIINLSQMIMLIAAAVILMVNP